MALLAEKGPRSRSHKIYRRVDDMSWPEKGHAAILIMLTVASTLLSAMKWLEAGHAKLSWASEVVGRSRKRRIANE